MQKKRIHNTKTKTYLKRRQRTTKNGNRGQIKGKWKNKRKEKMPFSNSKDLIKW